MRVGLLGAGRIGAFHARALAGLPGVERVVVADLDRSRAEEVAAAVGGEAAGGVDEAIDSGLDAAAIAASTAAHATLIEACLDAGLPTFCEKPVALDWEETLRIVERVEENGDVLQVGFHRRFDAGFAEGRRLLVGGSLGTPYLMHMFGHDHEPPPEEYLPSSGGIYRDLHIHEFDALRWMTGDEVEEVYAQGGVLVDEMFARHGDSDTTSVSARMCGGLLAVMTGSRHDAAGYDVRAEIFGSKGSVCVGLDDRTPLRSVEPAVEPPPGPPYTGFLDRFADAYRAELAHFVRLAAGEAENPCTARDSLEALRIAVAAERSAAEKRPVSPSEAFEEVA